MSRIICWPDWSSFLGFVTFCVAFVAYIGWKGHRYMKERGAPWALQRHLIVLMTAMMARELWWIFAFNFGVIFLNEPWRFVAQMGFVIWSFARRWPWDKWKKQLSSKVSSMTEVARAAFKRQQSEAFG